MEKLIQQGAEAKIILKDNQVIKRRIKKSYRISEIDDKIRKLRTRSEGKMIERASKIISTPKIIKVDEKNKEILMEFIEGKKLSENLDKFHEKEQERICKKIGENIAKIHDLNIIHGDLTTSNMIYVNNKPDNKTHSKIKKGTIKNNFQIYFIDFGLGFYSSKIEDKAVDLHLLKEALEARHFNHSEKLFKSVCKGYLFSKENNKVLEQLKKVESRGRYKDKY